MHHIHQTISIFYFLRNFMASFMPVFIVGISIPRIIRGQMSIGTLIAVFGFLDAVYLPVTELFSFRSMKNNFIPIMKRTRELLCPVQKQNKRVFLNTAEPMIQLQEVSLNLAGKPVLEHVHFTVRGTGLYHLKGDNGAGKSAVLNVISGLYQDYEGQVSLGFSSPKQRIVYMQQENQLFQGTPEDNISLFGQHPLRRETLDILHAFQSKEDPLASHSGGEALRILFLRAVNT